MKQARVIALAVGCTLLVVLVIVWPRFFPRYVDHPGGALDRWTGRTCSTVLSRLARERGDTVPLICILDASKGHVIQQDYRSTKWR